MCQRDTSGREESVDDGGWNRKFDAAGVVGRFEVNAAKGRSGVGSNFDPRLDPAAADTRAGTAASRGTFPPPPSSACLSGLCVSLQPALRSISIMVPQFLCLTPTPPPAPDDAIHPPLAIPIASRTLINAVLHIDRTAFFPPVHWHGKIRVSTHHQPRDFPRDITTTSKPPSPWQSGKGAVKHHTSAPLILRRRTLRNDL
jgi:hypothetical protein